MRKYILFGDFNKKYLIIFIIFLFTTSIEYFLICYIDKMINYTSKIRANKLLSSSLAYIGQFLCFIPLIISKKYNSKKSSTKNYKSPIEIVYIFNNSDNLINFKDKILIIIICFLTLINDMINILINHLINIGNIFYGISFIIFNIKIYF